MAKGRNRLARRHAPVGKIPAERLRVGVQIDIPVHNNGVFVGEVAVGLNKSARATEKLFKCSFIRGLPTNNVRPRNH